MSQNSNSSQKDQILPSYSQEVGEPKSSSQKSHDSGLSQEKEEMSPNQIVLTQAYKSQESSQQKSQVDAEPSQQKSQASSIATPSQADQAVKELVSAVVEHVKATTEVDIVVETGTSQTTSQPKDEKSTQ